MTAVGSQRAPLKMDDYCFGKRIVDQKNKPTGNFRPGAKKGLSLQPRVTADSLGPGGSYSVYNGFGQDKTFNKKGTFGAPTTTGVKKTQLLENGASYRQTTEMTSRVDSSFGKDIEKAPKFSKPHVSRGGRKIYDTTYCQGTSEMTSQVKSTFGQNVASSPKFSKPLTPRSGRQIHDVRHCQGAAEFTYTVPSSFQPAPRAKTPPATRSIRRTYADAESSLSASHSEFTTAIPSSFPKPNLIPKRVPVTAKRTDSWLKAPKDSGPGPGEYFVP